MQKEIAFYSFLASLPRRL